MEIKSAHGAALAGIQRGLRGMSGNAAEIASADRMTGGSVAEPLVESTMHARQVEASAKMVETIDDVLGTLIDEKA